MKKLLIEWKHFDKGGATCKRCSQTGQNLDTVIKQLRDECGSMGIDILFQETKLPESRMSESNQVLIDGVLLEKHIPNAATGENHCDSCSDLIDDPSGCNCRTVTQGHVTYEAIPVDLIKQAITNKLRIGVDYKLPEGKTVNIQVLGSGCATCKKLYEITKKGVSELDINAKVEYITDVSKLIEMGLMSSPALVIDGKVITVGFVPSIDQIKEALTTGTTKEEKVLKECSCGGKC